ncbi:MAG: hypothetical protein ACE5LU_05795 [Anaerolineae bacterium]
MHFHRRTAIVSAALMLIYAVTLHTLSSLTPTDGGAAQAQDYPPPSATLDGYPQPAVPTPTSPPTNTPVRLSPTPTPMRRQTATPQLHSPTPTSTGTPPITLTPAITIGLPPTATRRAPAATQEPLEQPVVLSPTAPGTVTPTPATEPAETPTPPETGLPLADLLPPVADRQTGPGTALTLLAGLVLAGLAWWVRQRWFTASVPAGVQNGEDTD